MTDSAPQFTAIAAMGRNRVIGKDGKLPWDFLPEDMAFFKSATLNHRIVMGRRTWESLGKALPHRWNIVLSSSPPEFEEDPSVIHVESLKQLFALTAFCRPFVIGGGQIYKLLMPWTTEILLTVIDQEPEGDTFFPEFESKFGEPEILQAIPGVEWRRYLRKLI